MREQIDQLIDEQELDENPEDKRVVTITLSDDLGREVTRSIAVEDNVMPDTVDELVQDMYDTIIKSDCPECEGVGCTTCSGTGITDDF